MNSEIDKELIKLADLIKEFYSLLAHSGEHRTLSVMYESQLTPPQIVALHYISKRGVCSISSISKRVGLTLGATSHLVDRLVRKGYLTRKENPNDRRMKLVEITDKGKEFLSRLDESRISDLIKALRILDKDLILRLTDVLRYAIDTFRRFKGESVCRED